MNDVTRILSAIEQGDPQAAEQLLPLVYDELRKLAAQRLAQEKPGQTLQATALVHEAYLRLVDGDQARHWDSRGHFFAAAAEAMRRILVENARRKQRSSTAAAGRTRRLVELDDSPTRPLRTTCSPSTRPSTSSVARTADDGPSWSSSATSPGSTIERGRRALGISPVDRPTATGPTPGPGSTSRSSATDEPSMTGSRNYIPRTHASASPSDVALNCERGPPATEAPCSP